MPEVAAAPPAASGQMLPAAAPPEQWPSPAQQLPVLVQLVGGGLTVLALTADVLRGNREFRIGTWQLALLAAGLVVFLSGRMLATAVWAAPIRDRWARHPIPLSIARHERWPFVQVLARVVVVALLLAAFRIESPAFYGRVVPLFVAGFAVHHLLPRAARLGAFGALSLVAILAVFGPAPGSWLVALGLAVIGICHLPVRFGTRVAALIAVGAALAVLRAGVVPAPWSAAIWPILGSMFVFRVMSYMYYLAHARDSGTRAERLAYFFMLPNVAFPLFPVVDFATFRRTYYDRPALEIYAQGVQWMQRGLLHLVLYRFVYQYGTLSPLEVTSGATLAQYLVANFGLYLRVSGQFHLVVGVLHLFGFRLPETHRFFFLASSFTDFWRRINIYWKEFMQKLVFNPAYFRLRRRWGDTAALLLATLAVFVATWVLHSYQWFWLLGHALLSTTDMLFWGVLAVLLMVNSLREVQRGRERSIAPTGTSVTLREGLRLGIRTAATFTVMCVLWGLWTSPTMTDFLGMVGRARIGVRDVAIVAAGLGLIALASVAAKSWGLAAPGRRMAVPGVVVVPLVLLWGTGTSGVIGRLPAAMSEVARDIRIPGLNRLDAMELQRGYYEDLARVERFNGELWSVYLARDARRKWDWSEFGIDVPTNDARIVTMRPLFGGLWKGLPFRTNRWGMRDRDYALAAPPGGLRVAVLGQSYVMGDGVADEETFENLLERRFNRDAIGFPFGKYEFLNFGTRAYCHLQQLALLESGNVSRFSPQVLLLVGHPYDRGDIPRCISRMLRAGIQPPWPAVAEAVRASGISPEMSAEEMSRRLQPQNAALIRWAFKAVYASASTQGMTPVYAMVPTPSARTTQADSALVMRAARDAGFRVIDLSGLFPATEAKAFKLAEWDDHPNAAGHRRIADALYPQLRAMVGGANAEEALP